MHHRSSHFSLLIVVPLALALLLGACTNKKVNNPLADVGSKQPDKVLFDRAMDAMKHNHFEAARLALQTLINTYPDSEYLARAKLAIGDSWYASGGAGGYAQAEAEYKDFITFFPNVPEAAEAQLKIANIHFEEMEKPDRDFSHAVRAEEEYRQLLQQFPDSKLVPIAKKRLLEVQEVLAEREFRIGRFYYLRGSTTPAIARLESLVDTYPLYSGADEALYMLGQAYEQQVEQVRAAKLSEAAKGRLIKTYNDQAAKAYDRILTRYPVMTRAVDAKARLEALHYTVPKATPEAIAQNKKEESSRSELGLTGRLLSNFSRHPDLSEAATVGEPTMADPKQTSATDLVRSMQEEIKEASNPAAGDQSNQVSVETVKSGAPPPNQPVPRSDNSASAVSSQDAAASQDPTATSQDPKDTGIQELKPLTDASSASANATQGKSAAADPPAAAPAQVNDVQNQPNQNAESASQQPNPDSAESSSSSKKKKKRGLGKLF